MLNLIVRYLDAISDNVKAYKHWFIYEYICWDTQEFKEICQEVYAKISKWYSYFKWLSNIVIQAVIGFLAMFISWLMLWCLFRG